MDKQVTLADIEAAIKAAKANKLPSCCDWHVGIHHVPLKVYQQVLNKYPEFIDDLRLNKLENVPYPYYSSSANYEGRSQVTIYSGRIDKLKTKLENELRYYEPKMLKMQEMMEAIKTELATLDCTEDATEKEILELVPSEKKRKIPFD